MSTAGDLSFKRYGIKVNQQNHLNSMAWKIRIHNDH